MMRPFATCLLLAALCIPLVAEPLTSVTQIVDVKATDPCFSSLQSLIERYGVEVPTDKGAFRPTQPISASEVQLLTRQGVAQFQSLAAASSIPARLLPPLQAKATLPAAGPVSQAQAREYLKSALGATATSKADQAVATRGWFVTELHESLELACRSLESLSGEQAVRDDFVRRMNALRGTQALALFSQLEAGKGDFGDPSLQKKVAQANLVLKAGAYLSAGQVREGEALFQSLFDQELKKAEAEVTRYQAKREKVSLTLASAALTQANAINSLRNSAYKLAGPSKPAATPNLAGHSRIAELQALLK